MDAIPISSARTLIPFVDLMYEIGAPVQRGLERCRLPVEVHEHPESLLSTRANWRFVSEMARDQGIEDLGFRVAYTRPLNFMGPRLLYQLLQSPTLLEALNLFSRLCKRESSGMRVWLSSAGATRRYCLKKSLGPESPGYGQTEWLGLMIMLTVIRLYAGRHWRPEEIALTTAGPIPDLAAEYFADTELLFQQGCIHLTLPDSMLSLGPSVWGKQIVSGLALEGPGPPLIDPAAGFSGLLGQLIEPYLAGCPPSVTLAAEIAGISTRTLQRRLAREGTSYSRLVDHARFRVAVRVLDADGARSTDAAYATGYSNPTHFARAFRRLAGCSPRDYRRRHRSGEQSTG